MDVIDLIADLLNQAKMEVYCNTDDSLVTVDDLSAGRVCDMEFSASVNTVMYLQLAKAFQCRNATKPNQPNEVYSWFTFVFVTLAVAASTSGPIAQYQRECASNQSSFEGVERFTHVIF